MTPATPRSGPGLGAGDLALAVLPRREDLVGLAGAAAAVLIAVQLGIEHWFYLYIPWFFGLAMLALLGQVSLPERRCCLNRGGRTRHQDLLDRSQLTQRLKGSAPRRPLARGPPWMSQNAPASESRGTPQPARA